ncbi:Auxin-induced protein 6B [Dendrobium catenatum]|uniref:Auxin-induced protein 6B n=1 Tax=Dendrobium catenatum TaxID=906689 RepID=A0A2I0VZ81_9ASPA|nr:Auxin-induced protein 6B [Dendrobium catenatum]
MKIYFIKGMRNVERKIALRGRDEEMKTSLIGREVEVPKGWLAVYVGDGMRRFVIPTAYLCMPEFREILDKMEKKFGFNQNGGLMIPCDEEDFEEIISFLDQVGRRKRKIRKKTMREKHYFAISQSS